ncbi:CheR family methyltransferase [Deferrisoma camini]|uniref:CheR family methyltransferase n=1 Tax=Deferrisoma camini TaxID=1035120 RepID=UPI00046D7B26|nr:protein-glutamate O-methyltransferase CheR [Deferrisoma camini]
MTPRGGAGPFALDERMFQLLAGLVEEYCGLRFDVSRRDLFAERVGRRVAALGLPGFLDYYYHLKYDPDGREELQRAVEELAINETYFFREPGPLETLVRTWIPERHRDPEPFRVWSVACSTGAEPYTLAIVAEEEGLADRVEIWASDIDRHALQEARAAVYGEGALRMTPPDKRDRWFERTEGGWRLKDPPRSRVRFFWANALEPGEAGREGRWHAILCRNLMIYFAEETIARVVDRFHRALRPGGVLLLGLTESLLRFDTPFRVEEVNGWFFYVKDGGMLGR